MRDHLRRALAGVFVVLLLGGLVPALGGVEPHDWVGVDHLP